MITRSNAAFIAIALVFIVTIFEYADLIPSGRSLTLKFSPVNEAGEASVAEPESESPTAPQGSISTTEISFTSSRQVQDYFEQVFSVDKPAPYEFPALRELCARTTFERDDVYLDCTGMLAGLTSIMSQVKVCLKMAVEAGSGLILPAMPLRDNENIKELNFMNLEAYMTYEKWFDEQHLIEQLGRVCPRVKVIHPDNLNASIPVKNRWYMDITKAPDYHDFSSYFWVGRPFKLYFDEEFAKLENTSLWETEGIDSGEGITVIQILSKFILYRITDDPTRADLRLWTDIAHLIRFKPEPRQIVHRLLSRLDRPFFGVHFRVENDTIWSSFEHQLSVDLDGLDKAWEKYGKPGMQKPLVYLACGDPNQVQRFALAGKERGWEVTHKWQLAESDPDTLAMINDLPFDFQGAVDMGIMLHSAFFFGITGSAFSTTVAHARDITGRYRGSSFFITDDENARSHLFNDGDSSAYACCL